MAEGSTLSSAYCIPKPSFKSLLTWLKAKATLDPASDNIPRTGKPIFTSLPREIRDCIYKAAFDTNGNLNNYVGTFQSFTVGYSKLTPFAVIAHKWAARSRVAREACITFYEHKMFDVSAQAIQDLIPNSFARTVAQQLDYSWLEKFHLIRGYRQATLLVH